MKQGIVQKGGEPGPEDLEKIGRYTRREFAAGELYVFPVVLCDNEVDRDGERFTADALEKLAELFVGKPGIFDHARKAENQAARIYECRVERDPRRLVSTGEPYACLAAKAYLPRTEKNAELIARLESGIQKEVSVGCSVGKVTCSVCGADLRNGRCPHERGKTYAGKLCCAELGDPRDAYEWSFVAVPAQREAGVVKSCRKAMETEGTGTEELLKTVREARGPVTLTQEQGAVLLEKMELLEKDAAFGRAYREGLVNSLVRCEALARPQLPSDAVRRAAEGMSIGDLKCFEAACRKQAEKTLPLSPQLAGAGERESADGNEPYRI